jgi:hypothetical protein
VLTVATAEDRDRPTKWGPADESTIRQGPDKNPNPANTPLHGILHFDNVELDFLPEDEIESGEPPILSLEVSDTFTGTNSFVLVE